jgi:hypothetical protein
MTSRHRRLPAAFAGLGLAGLVLAGSTPNAVALGPAPFVVAPLPQATGVQYPAGVTRNEDVEPGVGVDGAGTIWVGSNIDPNVASDPRSQIALSGEDIWASTDGGRTFHWVADPFNATASTPALGGEDSDLAAAPEKNANGFYNVYATSLYVAASNIAVSQDGGKTFTTNPLGGVPAQDRPWLTADGPCTYYLTYHQLPLFLPVVNRYDACTPTNAGIGATVNPVSQTAVFAQNSLPGATNGFNKPAVDISPTSPHRHNLYVPMEACDLQSPQDFLGNVVATAEQVPTCPSGVNTFVEVAVSTDNGASFTVSRVATNSNGEQEVWPTSVAVDQAGTVAVSWSDNHNAFFATSKDGGLTWSKPAQLNVSPARTAVFPTVAGGVAGVFEVAYYGTSTAADSNDEAALKDPGTAGASTWHLFWTKSADGGATFTQQQVGGVNHTGVLCTKGSSCTVTNSRNLYDDFGIVISPTTQRASIAFDADQPLAAAPLPTGIVDPFTAYATELTGGAAVSGIQASGGQASGSPAATSSTVGAATPNTDSGTAGAGAGLVGLAAFGAAAAGLRRRRLPS